MQLEQVKARVRRCSAQTILQGMILLILAMGHAQACSSSSSGVSDRIMEVHTVHAFMAINCRLALTKSSAAQLYSSDFLQNIFNLMERAEFNKCWREISLEGVPTSTSIGATSQTLFWEEVETEVNKLFRGQFIVGRSGKMICLTDEDKFHFESHPKNNKVFNVKTMKHVNGCLMHPCSALPNQHTNS